MRYLSPESVVVNSLGASGSSGPGELDLAGGLHPVSNMAKANMRAIEAMADLNEGIIVSIKSENETGGEKHDRGHTRSYSRKRFLLHVCHRGA